ncbi:MAG: HAD hydrolase family protein [Alcanivorax sp.]|uniref:KdsC family phosphatase n=1 Tax=Alcanivorax sp. TaxID=1872427 RepID=UPI00199083E5|nr:HAD hydrolase family protein [Alcanivorax sp.]MBD3644592.1 HAD hydrolase family protein [Alcanivorax sp.]MDF1726019.1 HAD hydrolase family protein [Alcanivorax sp.]
MPMQLSSIDAQNLRLMAFDVDGVMTDGRIYFSPEGEAIKVFNTLDGHGLKKLAASGVTLAIITGRNTPMVAKRAADLGITHVIQGREDKGVALADLAEKLGIAASETGYAGDDEPDVSALDWARLSFAPANAHDCAKTAADHITERRGGEGAVREICDAILAQRSPA